MRDATNSRLRWMENSASPPALKLDETKILLALATVPEWGKNGDVILRTFQFKDFPAAIKFIASVAQIAEEIASPRH